MVPMRDMRTGVGMDGGRRTVTDLGAGQVLGDIDGNTEGAEYYDYEYCPG